MTDRGSTMADISNVVVPADTLEYFRLRRELRQANLPLDKALFTALREAFSFCRGRQPHTSRELAEYYLELSEAGRDVADIVRQYARE
jgi:hypothetical protein